ncbi:LicD family protein [Lentilactobacillus kisonensis]|uniref:LICD family protein n=2 Tax=Lentilactobacillus kisonensis TaxID=481722 RepID=H1LGA0_9LACO|nr:LicD family protein [Lentilactobacillus kisonensis]EHO51112.1 LICD family protein [Lentilactobacillus kisonensis F0435]KRL23427.1 LICD family protein [Lentilactobacillus kisonensis DSM 19906 = JCM 15041]
MMIDMKQIHVIQLDILRKVAKLISKYHINYFMTGGSAIGAVRHHGFIPWDDDIDIGLTRQDFEKFLTVAPIELESTDYVIEENRLNPRYEYDFAKVMTRDSQILERGREAAKAHNGIFIDVFPFDKMPLIKQQQSDQKMVLQNILMEVRRRFYSADEQGLTNHPYSQLTLPQLYNLRLRTMTQYDDQPDLPYVNLSSPYAYGKEIIFPDEMQHLIQVPFENLRVPILAAYDSYLKRLYGDYMKLPPVEKRIQRHILRAKVDNRQPLQEDDVQNTRTSANGFKAEAG